MLYPILLMPDVLKRLEEGGNNFVFHNSKDCDGYQILLLFVGNVGFIRTA
jgi:hypothetical protein